VRSVRSHKINNPSSRIIGVLCIILLVSPFLQSDLYSDTLGTDKINFSQDVAPILSDACFKCHGPDENKRKEDLRLDLKEGLFRTRKGVTVVKPGDVNASELVLRITSTDDDERMPPLKAVRQLKPGEIDILKRWVEQGAVWSGHWAFKAPDAVKVPEISNTHNPIDAFIVAKLHKVGMHAKSQASAERLLRRVTLDLTGLPPTPEEVDRFLKNPSSQAYTQLVDRLLNSPHYGERMASEWLDVARYADTHGYQMDRARAMWPYRDWVINAYNNNMRYDQFAIWQIAGDLLPSPTKEQRLATAFNRLHNQNEEGGIVEEEYRVAYVADRVATFGTAFLGLTLDCCRCHDHKFDPISQKDYYSLFSFFQNIDEAGQISYAGFADSMPVPTLLLTTDAEDEQLNALRKQTGVIERTLVSAKANLTKDFSDWLSKKGELPVGVAGLVAEYTMEAQQSMQMPAKNNKPAYSEVHVSNRSNAEQFGIAEENPLIVESEKGYVSQFEGDNGYRFPGVGHFDRTQPFSFGLWVKLPKTTLNRAVILHYTKAAADAGSRGYELVVEQGKLSFGMHYLWPGASLKITTQESLDKAAWVHLAVTYDGSSKAAGAHIYINGKLAKTEVIKDGLFKSINYKGKLPDLTIGYRFRDDGFKEAEASDLTIYNRELSQFEIAQIAHASDYAAVWNKPESSLNAQERQILFEYYTLSINKTCSQIRQTLQDIREKQNQLISHVPEVMVMEELPKPKPAYILQRGVYDQHGSEVFADTPHAFGDFPVNYPRNRLGLAQWLTSPSNPLFARVAVNRLWQMMFGRGIVETSDNFGLQGAAPTHPELLDWLARDFISHGYDIKRTLRLIAMSETYRQSSEGSAEELITDPQNSYLARGPAKRLTAEMIRDQALASSGLLIDKQGGPSVFPYQPPGLWEEIAMGKPHYTQGVGDDLHRRSLYTFWKRTVPPPAMVIFDASERNVCTVRRQSTSTPLQALELMNDIQIVESARFIGERILKEAGGLESSRINWGFKCVTGRSADQYELATLSRLYSEQHKLYTDDPKAAEHLINFGVKQTSLVIPDAERAAWTVVGLALLNTDEALMSR
jgi:Protein of unknown function (DUF1553)/Protein of unknown function (DUF1549)/Concanavalin A-like lectin/glucanases superfamily/Planctomycete cytochrome C